MRRFTAKKLLAALLIALIPLAACPPLHAAGFKGMLKEKADAVEIWAYPDVRSDHVAAVAKGIRKMDAFFAAGEVGFGRYAPKILLVANKKDFENEILMSLSGIYRNRATASELAGSNGGIAYSSHIVILAPDTRSFAALGSNTAHEMSHLYQRAIGSRSRYLVPQWYIEGTADYWAAMVANKLSSGLRHDLEKHYWDILVAEKEVPDLLLLRTNTEWRSARALAKQSNFNTYALAYHAVIRLAKSYGEDKLLLLYKVLEEKNKAQFCSFDQAFAEVFGTELAKFTEQYAGELKEANIAVSKVPLAKPLLKDLPPDVDNPQPEPAYKGLKESWNPTYIVHEFDVIAPPPGVNWAGKNTHDWVQAAKEFGWVVETDPNKPSVGAIIVRSNRPGDFVWIGIVRAVADGKITVERRDKGEVRTYTLAVAELPQKHFAGYILPVRAE